ncbi:MAG: cysteine synthase A [Deltaproteobacteria bacterium]|nr:MAG: cysteine synthase A [Deltaproteobacteria bacterium]
MDDILGRIGNTPLVRLDGLVDPRRHATLWGKCEMANPGGSVKDRIALSMIRAGERAGRLRPGETVIVEPTSGNTGIGLALVCAVRGYRLILTMPESMSLERRKLLKAYGAEILLTPDDRTMEGAVAMAEDLCRKPDHVMLQQFENPANPEVHRRTTGPEILAQMAGRSIDGFVSAVGTGGTITGVGQVLRKHNPAIRIVAVEPARSPVLSGGEAGPHKIQGIGAGFVPPVLDTSVYDRVETIWDEDAWRMKEELARTLGILAGISSGAAVLAAVKLAEELGPGKNVVTVLCDTGERYFSLGEYFAGHGRKRRG